MSRASPRSSTTRRIGGWFAANWPILLLCAVLTISAIVVSPKKPLWNDELFSYYFLTADSFATMLAAFNDAINNTPFVYFGLGWVWVQIFGDTPLALRLFSSLGFSLAAGLIWLVLRRAYGFWPAAFGCLGVFATSGEILWGNVEARMYGLFLAFAALCLVLYDRLFRELKPGGRLLVTTFFAHAALVHTHLFGMIFSGAFALGITLSDLSGGPFDPWRVVRRRWPVFLAIGLAWLSFLLYLPAFLAQSEAGVPYSWMPRPRPVDLIDVLFQSDGSFLRIEVLVALALFVAALSLLPRDRSLPDSLTATPSHLTWLALVLLGLPVAIWLGSQFMRPIFFPRYLLPCALGWAIVLAMAAHRLLPAGQAPSAPEPGGRIAKVQALALGAAALALLGLPLEAAWSYRKRYPPGDTDAQFMPGYEHLPIVIQSANGMLERTYHSAMPGRYFYVMDWKTVNTPDSGRFGIQQYKHMQAWVRSFPELFGDRVVNGEDFLAAHDAFLIITNEDFTAHCRIDVSGLQAARDWPQLDCPQWVARRLLPDPEWNVTQLTVQWDQAYLLVRRSRAGG